MGSNSDDWRNLKWGDLVELKYGKSLKGYKDNQSGVPVFGTNGQVGFCSQVLCDFPSIIIGRKGAYRGVHFSDEPFYVIDTAFYIVPKVPLNIKWAYYELLTQDINGLDSGSAIPSTRREDFYSLPVKVPPLQYQDKLVNILDNLNFKVRLNQNTNQTLEQMAQALFKSWFVDFDPVVDNALAAGNPIPEELAHRVEVRKKAHAIPDFQPLPDNIRNLFPSEFEQTDEPTVGIGGWVPKGWQVTSMHEMVETVSKTYNLKEVDEVIFLNTGDIESGKILHNEYSSTIGLPGQAKKTIKKGDILYSEIRPQNKRYAFVNFDAEEYVVSTKLMVLRAKEGLEPLLPYFLLTQEETVNELQRIAEHRSGTFPQITYKELSKVLTVLPQEAELVTLFVEQYLKPSYAKKASLTQHNTQLTKIRDTLLPKLISGEIQLDSSGSSINQ
ncbi:restriction endonuclease subunit S [Alteromonas portus]|uniref:restriction endonuclease subunit S n=1 Tax=Alteromonas portus TaxID=2565549 RepID=UPI003BF8DD8B